MRILILGLGGAGQRHLRLVLERFPKAEIITVRHRGRLFEISDDLSADFETNIVKKYSLTVVPTLEDALSLAPAFAIIATPTSFHSEQAEEIVKSGISVLIEKPLGAASNAAKNLLEQAKKTGAYVQIGYMWRYHPAVKLISEYLKSELNGDLIKASVASLSYFPGWHKYEDFHELYAAQLSLGGGVIPTESHELDLLCEFFGHPTKMRCIGSRDQEFNLDVIDSAQIELTFEVSGSQVDAEIELSFLSTRIQRTIEICSEKSKLVWDLAGQTLVLSSENLEKNWSFSSVSSRSLQSAQLDSFYRRITMGEMTSKEANKVLVTSELINDLNSLSRASIAV